MSSGSITLGEVAEHTAVLAVACNRYDRAGRYRLDTLIARGADFSVRICCAYCPRIAQSGGRSRFYDLCGMHCPDLPKFFLT
jgi:hypothetical protein